MTKDPIGPEAGGDTNPYRYSGNNPISNVDPTGMLFCGALNACEQYGEYAAQYYANAYVAAESQGDVLGMIGNAVGGGIASLWTPETSDATALILTAGVAAGRAMSIAGIGTNVGWKGGEVVFSNASSGQTLFRFNPTGHHGSEPGSITVRTDGSWQSRLPHWHRRGINPATGQTIPGQGIGQHRPYQGGP